MMSKGVVLFALNNNTIDYIKLAESCAKRVSTFLKVPVSLITDKISSEKISNFSLFDKIILIEEDNSYYIRTFKNGNDKVKDIWKNSYRHSIYNLTPYDETLVIDVDYIINSDLLSYCWDQPHDFLIYKDSYDLASWRSSKDYNYISQYSVPFYWATVFFFRKTETTQALFSLITHIKENWEYYNFLYQINGPNFRNDFAFSIAIHIMNGKTTGDFAKSFPGKLFYSLDSDMLTKINNNKLFLLLNKKDDLFIPSVIENIDVHVMNKFSLLKVLEND
jgi:hypothetical protein